MLAFREAATPDKMGNKVCAHPLLVAVTGMPEDVERLKDAGFDHFLAKPVGPDVITNLLVAHAACLEGRSQTRHS